MTHSAEVIKQSRRSAPQSLEQWRAHVESWQHSGLTQREFCLRHGFARSTFNRQVGLVGKAQKTEAQLAQASSAGPSWLEVRLSAARVERVGESGEWLGEGFEVVLGGRRRVRLGPQFDATGLRRLIEVLEGLPC
jgi:hypothetical protein